jgi:hypothetical protein
MVVERNKNDEERIANAMFIGKIHHGKVSFSSIRMAR